MCTPRKAYSHRSRIPPEACKNLHESLYHASFTQATWSIKFEVIIFTTMFDTVLVQTHKGINIVEGLTQY